LETVEALPAQGMQRPLLERVDLLVRKPKGLRHTFDTHGDIVRDGCCGHG
jgi:hypothetical protein